ncbi:DUF1343 domain-containing protein [Treponema sp.]
MDSNLGPVALFGPEHGFRGIAQDAVEIEDEVFRGIPSYSLYGKRFKPEPEMLRGLDAVVYDMQDVGCRYYTFLYTLAYIMESCQENRVPLVVLDRPNPLGGDKVEGSPIPDAQASFVGGYGLAPRYGMTIGEFALYLKGEYYPKTELEIIELENWSRELPWSETGLPWPLPSPNIPSLSCAEVYPGTCLVEGTWFSEGRGTTRPFEIIGAPWIDGERLREKLATILPPDFGNSQFQQNLPSPSSSGAVFSSLFFSPTISKHKGENCEGVLLNVMDKHSFNSLNTGIAIVRTIKELWPSEFRFRETWEDSTAFFFDKLAGGPKLRILIDNLAPLDECIGFANEGRDQFLKRREKYLIYPTEGQSST